jgi:hypothetical protein
MNLGEGYGTDVLTVEQFRNLMGATMDDGKLHYRLIVQTLAASTLI